MVVVVVVVVVVCGEEKKSSRVRVRQAHQVLPICDGMRVCGCMYANLDGRVRVLFCVCVCWQVVFVVCVCVWG